MVKRFICGDQKYELGGQKGDSITLPVFPAGLQEKIGVKGYTLFLKTSFHVSLVCVGKIIARHSVTTPDFLNNVVEDFCSFTSKSRVDLHRYRDEFRFVEQGERKSVIVMCDVGNLNNFFDLVNKKYKLPIEYPPTHVTLYTLQPNAGIYLTESGDIQKITKIIPNPIGTAPNELCK